MNNKKKKTRHNYLIGVILDNAYSGQLLRGRIYIGFVHVSPTFEKSNCTFIPQVSNNRLVWCLYSN